MALLWTAFVSASCVLTAATQAAAGTASRGENPLAQIDAAGSMRVAQHTQVMDDSSHSLMRQEVRRHTQEAPESIEFEQLDEVHCPVDKSLTGDAVSLKLCKILTGSNAQVAGKLERAVKGLSLRPKTPNATEMVVADSSEEKQLANLKAALWDLWFCAKRVDPPCDPLVSKDHKVEVARIEAFRALAAIHKHPEAGMSTTLAPEADADSERIDHMAGGSVRPVPEEAVPSQSPIGWSTAHSHRIANMPPAQDEVSKVEPSSLLEANVQEVPVGTSSKSAERALNGLLHGNDRKKIAMRLWNAINKMDIQKVLEDDIVKIEDDADGNYKALKANLLLLHECATMAECPATDCCNPKSPEQAQYKEARNGAYQAYHNIQHDTSLAKQTYLDLLSTVATQKQHHDYYPPSHPLYVPTEPPEIINTTVTELVNVTHNVAKPAPPVEEGSMLLIAICMTTGIVILAIAFLLYKTNQMDTESKDGLAVAGEETWGGEYGGENTYGNY